MDAKKLISCILSTSIILSGCAGREAKVVPAIQSGDDGLGCLQLREGMIFNTKEIQGLIRERNGDVAGNAAATIAGAFLLVPLFFLDTKNAASKEAKGLIRRNQVLAERYKLKNCTPVLEEYKENPIVLDYNVFYGTSESTNTQQEPKSR